MQWPIGLLLGCTGLAAACLVPPAAAHEGLQMPQDDRVWPQWRARIALQTSAVAPAGGTAWLDGAEAQRIWRGAAVLGDYTLATPSFGRWRASAGLLIGRPGGGTWFSADVGPQLQLSVQRLDDGPGHPAGARDILNTPLPYVGLGFSGSAWHNSLSLSADVGLAGEPASASAPPRTLLGNQGKDRAWRELRLSPVLQLGLRYSF
ncbi:MAG: hypothetical protein LH480_10995 [Rubrivivax sp.]|nr:hypothetical protein [Rubrivivax sp.]